MKIEFEKSKKILCTIDKEWSVLLDNCKEVYGHDDTLPFNADVFVFEKAEEVGYFHKIAVAYNDGWGGESVVEPTMTKYGKNLGRLDAYLKSHFEIVCDNGIKWDVSLEYLISTMAAFCIDGNIEHFKITQMRDCKKKKIK